MSSRTEAVGILSASTHGVIVSSSSTWGSWVELKAATSMDSELCIFTIGRDTANVGTHIFQIAIGGAGTEGIIIDKISDDKKLV